MNLQLEKNMILSAALFFAETISILILLKRNLILWGKIIEKLPNYTQSNHQSNQVNKDE